MKNYFVFPEHYDIIVVGAGHAGCEAALVASKMGRKVLLLTISLESIAQMSCNPAIGGLAKGHLVREIDALGGVMAKVIDKTGIQFKMLNTGKGPAVQAPRAQADKKAYQAEMRRLIQGAKGLHLRQALVDEVIAQEGRVQGVVTNNGTFFPARAVILTTGTFLQGLIHIGTTIFSGGRAGELASNNLSESLRALGLTLGRLKTGTSPRIVKKSLDLSRLIPQYGDGVPRPFSFSSSGITQPQMPCYLGYTNSRTHEVIRKNLHRAPLYSGQIKGIGPRYCPSIEDKVVKFPQKERHQIFFEPEGLETDEMYLNGLSTSLPEEVQWEVLRTVEGMEKVHILRPGYAIEYDFVPPSQLKPSLECKKVEGLFLAGQINGTSGYEEAAAQGLMAGINASLKLAGKEPLILARSEAYMGVLIDDLVTKDLREPYRMFTSRAEYRLLLRHDNADQRLMAYGHSLGLIEEEQFLSLQQKKHLIAQEIDRLRKTRLSPSLEVNMYLTSVGTSGLEEAVNLEQLLKRPLLGYDDIASLESGGDPSLPPEVKEQVEIEIKYEGYIKRQMRQVERLKELEEKPLPPSLVYSRMTGLSFEAREKLERFRPATLGQASRVDGVKPSDLSVLMIYMKRAAS